MSQRLRRMLGALTACAATGVAPLNGVAQMPAPRDTRACTADASGIPASQWLQDAAAAIGMQRVADKALHYVVSTARDMADESDRAYPPFLEEITRQERWLNPSTGVEQLSVGAATILRGPRTSVRLAGDTLVPAPQIFASLASQRRFNPWTVLADWQRDSAVRVVGRCGYLDYPRVVLSRRMALGVERLYLDPRSRFPMRLESVELHYFLGPVHDDYRYTGWSDVAPFTYYPTSTIKLTDGLGKETWSVFPGQISLAPIDSAPSPLVLPDSLSAAPSIPPPRFGDDMPDTVRVGSHTFLLVNSRFTSVVTLAADTVFLIDATAGEPRARRDSAWVSRLFPGHHPVVLVLLSAVWPHIAGLRFWVASGALVVGHTLTGPTVTNAVARRWTEYPDALERQRQHAHLQFVSVTHARTLANGGVQLYELDGAGNESTLMAYLPHDHFLWASDRVQDTSAPSLYTTELVQSVDRLGLRPQWTSGPHFRLVPWDQITRLAAEAH